MVSIGRWVQPLLLVAALSACQDRVGADAPINTVKATDLPKYDAVKSPRITTEAIQAVQAGVAAEPKVIDFLFDPELVVELTVAVKDDGSRRNGYAGYYCQKLREWGAYDDDMDVRIVDAARLVEANGDFRSISLGTVHCADNTFLD